MKVDMNFAMAHRDLYYLNQFKSKATHHEVHTIMHDKIDHSKAALLELPYRVKHIDGLTKLPLAVTGMLAHGHVDMRHAYYSLEIYSHDANYTVGSFAKLLRDLESSLSQPPGNSFQKTLLTLCMPHCWMC